MMVINNTSAPITKIEWSTWSIVELQVKQLQFRIAKAIRDGRHSKSFTMVADSLCQIAGKELPKTAAVKRPE